MHPPIRTLQNFLWPKYFLDLFFNVLTLLWHEIKNDNLPVICLQARKVLSNETEIIINKCHHFLLMCLKETVSRNFMRPFRWIFCYAISKRGTCLFEHCPINMHFGEVFAKFPPPPRSWIMCQVRMSQYISVVLGSSSRKIWEKNYSTGLLIGFKRLGKGCRTMSNKQSPRGYRINQAMGGKIYYYSKSRV
jgi:hypothetical protein